MSSISLATSHGGIPTEQHASVPLHGHHESWARLLTSAQQGSQIRRPLLIPGMQETMSLGCRPQLLHLGNCNRSSHRNSMSALEEFLSLLR